jgi:iron complex outermembrane receptor protein
MTAHDRPPRPAPVRSLCLGLALILAMTAPAAAQTPQDLKRMSLEQLLQLDVSTVSRQDQPADKVPAAIFVITQDDIRRSGATSLPDVLRLAPGVQVERINASLYSVGIRGFGDRLSRAMLVLIDGRAVYSPLFAGTYWEVQDPMLADVERIEIIRGPGGTLWGANAVNGIINVITKTAKDTEGALVSVTAGTDATGPIAARYGGAVGKSFRYRVYGEGTDLNPQFHPDGVTFDTFTIGQGGFRGDWTLSHSRSLTLQGDAYHATLGEPAVTTSLTPPFSTTGTQNAPLSGANVLLKWAGPSFHGGSFQLQTYFDHTSRDEVPVGEKRDTFDVDFQDRRTLARRHDVIWGAGYRLTSDDITAVAPSAILPPRRTDSLVSAFVQDDLTAVPERLHVIVGAKVEDNSYSGGEIQPSARAVWTVDDANTLFASVTRAVRTPSRVETDYTTMSVVATSPLTFVRLLPDPNFDPESLVAYELGYRVRPIDRLYLKFSGFDNSLSNILSTDLESSFVETDPTGPSRTILPVMFGNGLHGKSYGGEIFADFRPVSWWRWTGSYSYLRITLAKNPGDTDVASLVRDQGQSPHHEFSVQSSIDLPANVSLDCRVWYESALAFGPVPAFTTSTVRLGWRLRPDTEIAVVGDNLNSPHHLELVNGPFANVEIQRSVAVNVVWRK